MRKRKPLITVLMPVFNADKYVGKAIESILNQSFKDYEFIIVDDGSTDDSWKIINNYRKKDPRIVTIKNKFNLRTTKSLNCGLKKAKGKYVVRMDADDWSYPYRLRFQYNYMEKHPDVGVSGGKIEVCNKDLVVINKRAYAASDKKIREKIFRYSPFAHPATIWRFDILKKAGYYNECLPLSQDYELYFRVGKISKFGNLNKILIKLRTHNDSSSILKGKYQEQYAIYSRIKAFLEFGYSMSYWDKLYTFLQMISMVIISPRIKFWIFNRLRRQK